MTHLESFIAEVKAAEVAPKELKAILEKIESDTCTVGYDSGIPHVAGLAKRGLSLVDEFRAGMAELNIWMLEREAFEQRIRADERQKFTPPTELLEAVREIVDAGNVLVSCIVEDMDDSAIGFRQALTTTGVERWLIGRTTLDRLME